MTAWDCRWNGNFTPQNKHTLGHPSRRWVAFPLLCNVWKHWSVSSSTDRTIGNIWWALFSYILRKRFISLNLEQIQDVSVLSLARTHGWCCYFLGKIQEVYLVTEPVKSRAASSLITLPAQTCLCYRWKHCHQKNGEWADFFYFYFTFPQWHTVFSSWQLSPHGHLAKVILFFLLICCTCSGCWELQRSLLWWLLVRHGPARLFGTCCCRQCVCKHHVVSVWAGASLPVFIVRFAVSHTLVKKCIIASCLDLSVAQKQGDSQVTQS